MFTKEEIQNSDKLQPAAKTWALNNFEYLCKPITALFSQSVKPNKGPEQYQVHDLYFQPADKVAKKTR